MPSDIDLFTPKSQKQYDLIWSDTDITFFGGQNVELPFHSNVNVSNKIILL